MEICEICSLCELFNLYLLKNMQLLKKKQQQKPKQQKLNKHKKALHRISLRVNRHTKYEVLPVSSNPSCARMHITRLCKYVHHMSNIVLFLLYHLPRTTFSSSYEKLFIQLIDGNRVTPKHIVSAFLGLIIWPVVGFLLLFLEVFLWIARHSSPICARLWDISF